MISDCCSRASGEPLPPRPGFRVARSKGVEPFLFFDCTSAPPATRARTATADERSKLWAQVQEIYPPYDDYQRTAKGREIPVVVLEPSGPPTT